MILVALHGNGMCHIKWFEDSEKFNEACISVGGVPSCTGVKEHSGLGNTKRDVFWSHYRKWSRLGFPLSQTPFIVTDALGDE